jgi:hypothetical protein
VLWPSSSSTSSRHGASATAPGSLVLNEKSRVPVLSLRFLVLVVFRHSILLLSQDTTITRIQQKRRPEEKAAAYTPNVTSGMGDAASNHPVSPFLLNFLSVNRLLVAAGCSCPQPTGSNLDLVAAAAHEISLLEELRFRQRQRGSCRRVTPLFCFRFLRHLVVMDSRAWTTATAPRLVGSSPSTSAPSPRSPAKARKWQRRRRLRCRPPGHQ